MNNEMIKSFLDDHDYDIRKSHNGRWIDQKCTMDVLCVVADCIMEYTNDKTDKSFTVNDIWHSEYTVENVQEIFNKPNPDKKASNEYDKYFGQPISCWILLALYMAKKISEDILIQLLIKRFLNI